MASEKMEEAIEMGISTMHDMCGNSGQTSIIREAEPGYRQYGEEIDNGREPNWDEYLDTLGLRDDKERGTIYILSVGFEILLMGVDQDEERERGRGGRGGRGRGRGRGGRRSSRPQHNNRTRQRIQQARKTFAQRLASKGIGRGARGGGRGGRGMIRMVARFGVRGSRGDSIHGRGGGGRGGGGRR